MKAWRRLRAWILLIGMFFRELALSVHHVALAVLWPGRVQSSGIVAVPLSLRSDMAISTLANMITLTPGTTSLHVSDDRSLLYIHVMNLSDDVVEQIKTGFEHRVKEALE